MAVGNHWSYSVKSDFDTVVDDVTVSERVAVGDQNGFQLRSNLGSSRFAWKGPVLAASELCGQRFDPPIPLIATTGTKWNGIVETAGRRSKGRAQLTLAKTKERYANRDYDALQSDLSCLIGTQSIHLTTWFVEGIGILKQEQKTGEKRDRRIEYLSGP